MGKRITYMFIFALCMLSCGDDELIENGTDEVIDIETPDWSEQTHSDAVDPDYSTVFPRQKVLRFDIKIESKDWQEMQNNLAELSSVKDNLDARSFPEEEPVFVPCSFSFDNTEWYKVGIRYKGNSSLYSLSRSNSKKYSFKVDFDEFEDTYPAIKNQRFFGFKQLNLNNNFKDESFMRQKVAADLFREFGVPSARTAFCAVYINYGSGSQYFGLYTLVEELDDTVLDDQFGSDDGNLYQPDGDAATFAYKTYNEDGLEKKNNEDAADYSDVNALYEYLNSSFRTSDSNKWKSDLNSVFNIDQFLKWLAANTVMQNWNAYGNKSHNYYLYKDPATARLTWIPWDNTEALTDYDEGAGGSSRRTLSLSLSEVDTQWPLINYLISSGEYKKMYNGYVGEFSEDIFNPAKVIATYTEYYDLVKEYAYSEESGFTFLNSESEFDDEVTSLIVHVRNRKEAVDTYLKDQAYGD